MNFTCKFLISSHPEPERDWQAQYPLAVRGFRKNVIDQVIGFFRHPLAAARWTKPTAFAGIGNRPLKVTALTFCANKTVLKEATLEVTTKLLNNEFWKAFAIHLSLGDKRLEMLRKQ